MDQTTFKGGEDGQVGAHLFYHHLWTCSISLCRGGGLAGEPSYSDDKTWQDHVDVSKNRGTPKMDGL